MCRSVFTSQGARSAGGFFQTSVGLIHACVREVSFWCPIHFPRTLLLKAQATHPGGPTAYDRLPPVCAFYRKLDWSCKVPYGLPVCLSWAWEDCRCLRILFMLALGHGGPHLKCDKVHSRFVLSHCLINLVRSCRSKQVQHVSKQVQHVIFLKNILK